MKILLLTVRSDFGGGPRHVNQLVEQLPNNIEIYLGYPLDGDPYALMWKTSNRIKASFNLPYRKFSLSVLFNLIDFVKINNIEIIHSHGNGAGVYSRIIKRICKNVKVIHTYHGISDEYGSWIKGYINNLLGRILNKFSDIYICVSIVGNVRIGENSIIGIGSVVVNDIPSNCIVAGNPARKIKDM